MIVKTFYLPINMSAICESDEESASIQETFRLRCASLSRGVLWDKVTLLF